MRRKALSKNRRCKRSNAFDIVAAECGRFANASAFSISRPSRVMRFPGPRASEWLDWILRLETSSAAPGAPRADARETGKLKGDLTVFNWGDGTYWITGSYYLRQWHMRWFEHHAREGVCVRDISDATLGFSISGPKSRDLLARLTDQDVSNAASAVHGLRDLGCRTDSRQVGRLSVAGELGYEINCDAVEHTVLRRSLLDAGRDLGWPSTASWR